MRNGQKHMQQLSDADRQDGTWQFRQDVMDGLSAARKYLLPKYFYDEQGDVIFQQIMASQEYYLTRSEAAIFSGQKEDIITTVQRYLKSFDIVELGAGDASKSIHLLETAKEKALTEAYFPIDISAHIIEQLEREIPLQLPGLHVDGLAGDYFEMLELLNMKRQFPRLLLFLGSTIGNMFPSEALEFCKNINRHSAMGDMILVGFDLKKDPDRILAAYNDKEGITRSFNLNLLLRINKELGGDFQPGNFRHYPVYDPGTGSCKSYLISTCKQEVSLQDGPVFRFAKDEPIFMEVSQKYNAGEMEQMAQRAGFEQVATFTDKEALFTDVLWRKVKPASWL